MTLLYTYLVVDNEYEAADQLNKDIESIHQWSQKWLITFNPDKTEIMTISKKHHKPHHPPVYMGPSELNCNKVGQDHDNLSGLFPDPQLLILEE